MAVAIRTAAAVAGKTILNSLITGMIFEKIALSDSGATVRASLIMIILTRLVQSTIKCT